MNPIHPALAELARAAGEMPRRDLAAVLRLALANKDWLRLEHRVGDPTGYMRHVLYVDPADRFVITAITWLPGQSSPVHGHHVWCAYGVAEGSLTEERFRESRGRLTPLATRVLQPGELAEHDFDGKAIHRVSNRTRGTIVSLHLYGISAARLTTGINRLYTA